MVPKQVMDIHAQLECRKTIDRITELINCGIFNDGNRGHVLFWSAFIELMICLRDLLRKSEKYATRISFTDDILTNDYVKDVHDAVVAMRDAGCHIDSYKKHLGKPQYRASFIVVRGKGKPFSIGGIEPSSDYEDDLTFFHGMNRLYMKRHILRAFEEAKTLLIPLLPQDPFQPPLPPVTTISD